MAGFLKESGLDARAQVRSIFHHWPEIVGPTVATQTKRLHYRRGTLVVEVKTPHWRQELGYRKQELREKVNAFLGRGLVQAVEIQQ